MPVKTTERYNDTCHKKFSLDASGMHPASPDSFPASSDWISRNPGADRLPDYPVWLPPPAHDGAQRHNSTPPVAMKSKGTESTFLESLLPFRFGVGIGVVGVIFYIGCAITMATVPRSTAVSFFNSLLHGIDVEPILRQSVPLSEVILGTISTFILGWIAGTIAAGVYNCCLKK